MAAILAGVAALVVVALEARRTSLGFNDADDPRVMLSFFRQHPDVYTVSGLVPLPATFASRATRR
ncbi:MAG: hypothetical protein WD794_11490 [Mycobacteriales bacterium]